MADVTVQLNDIRAIVTDIEGTTTRISFVTDVLFPFARQHLAAFVRDHGTEPEVKAELDATRDLAERPGASDEEVIEILQDWIDEDRKATPLKTLQGLIWVQGYESGELLGHVYRDAVENLKRWHTAGRKLYVYSSGSVAAQKLLFSHSEAGDLTPLFSGYFDTKIGMKREAASYRHIVEEIGLPADQILFLSDIALELVAARTAGMQTVGLLRDSDPMAAMEGDWVRSFDEIELT